ncbi:MAG TPA: hypothetical protein HA359_04520 [Candidatus Poseidoniaceae archaeon]|jgi:hypothetical protein|nr:MAG TPA: hypothetical protein D7H84_04520 [Candidatus Poseidoniales archaeon]DAC59348.1 MAG TPA: hypothetical protein D7I03_04185 [Candidatus Poseidoniales archaeon]HII23504.1 hypothetical protein [Candidatus Poseidoniaceae archaeon]HII50519.1 hypothetical protein [Candidatus Poseidoniaceae archaeon]|tara:strand:- start:16078 stop:16515 length:438 start_codon:yes stop_codon:yes gene_type:complete
MKHSQQVGDDRGQMLLATGVVLLLSLLSMAVFSVKVAGLTSAHEPNADSVIETTKEVVDILPSLAENRTEIWISSGMERIDAAELAMSSIHDDLLHHGEIRGVEVKMQEIIVSVIDGTTMEISLDLGITDDSSTLQSQVTFTINN